MPWQFFVLDKYVATMDWAEAAVATGSESREMYWRLERSTWRAGGIVIDAAMVLDIDKLPYVIYPERFSKLFDTGARPPRSVLTAAAGA